MKQFAIRILAAMALAAPAIVSAATLSFTTDLTNFSSGGGIFGALGTLPVGYTAPGSTNVFTANNDFQAAGTTSASIPSWTIAGTVAVTSVSGNNYVEMTGTNGDNTRPGITTSAISITPASLYALSFDFAGGYSGNNNNNQARNSNLVEVLYSTNGTLFTSLGYVTDTSTSNTVFGRVYSWNLSFAGASQVFFRFSGAQINNGGNTGSQDGVGGRIDNVKLQAVPLPPIVWLLGSSMLGWLAYTRRSASR